MPFIRRFSEIQPAQSVFHGKEENGSNFSSTRVFLDLLELPEDETCDIDLKQAAVYIMAHLDRLATPHIPPLSFSKVFAFFHTFFSQSLLHTVTF